MLEVLTHEFLKILPKVLMAAAAGLLGGVVALFWSPKVRARSAIQYFAAGAVLAAVASGVTPEAERLGSVFGILAGFAAGGLVMIGLKWLVLKFERREKGQDKRPIGLGAAAAIDTLIDGALIAAGFSGGQGLGTLSVAALALELFFLMFYLWVPNFARISRSAGTGFWSPVEFRLCYWVGLSLPA